MDSYSSRRDAFPCRSRFILWILMVTVIRFLSACSDTGFSGDSPVLRPTPLPGRDDLLPTPLPTVVPTPTQDPTPSPPIDNCQPGTTVTQVKNLTGTLDQRQTPRKLVYELSLYDCPGTIPQTVVQSIFFDTDAHTAAGLGRLPFAVRSNGSFESFGSLNPVQGSDLFGKTGPNYWHHRSDQTISITAANRIVIVEIDVSNLIIIAPMFGQAAPIMTIPTYFKFGPAQPVRVNIQVTEGNAGWGLL